MLPNKMFSIGCYLNIKVDSGLTDKYKGERIKNAYNLRKACI